MHVVALIRCHQAVVGQMAVEQIQAQLIVWNHLGPGALSSGEVDERVALGGVEGANAAPPRTISPKTFRLSLSLMLSLLLSEGTMTDGNEL